MSDEPEPAFDAGVEAEAEFRVFHQAVHAQLRRYGARIMQQNGAADDITQEALTVLWQRWDTIPPEQRRAQAYRIAHHKAVDEIRRQVARDTAIAKLPNPPQACDHDAVVDLAVVRDAISALPRQNAR